MNEDDARLAAQLQRAVAIVNRAIPVRSVPAPGEVDAAARMRAAMLPVVFAMITRGK